LNCTHDAADRFRPVGTPTLFGLGGIAGLSLDLDHVITLVALGKPVNLYTLSHEASRFLHWPVIVGSGIVLCLAGACFAGFLFAALAEKYWHIMIYQSMEAK